MSLAKYVSGLGLAMEIGCSKAGRNAVVEALEAGAVAPGSVSGEVRDASAPSATIGPDAANGGAFRGRYTAENGSLYVPDGGDYAGFRFRGDTKSTDALGDGTLSLMIDAAGDLSGEGDGALGPFAVTGVMRDDTVRGTIRPKDALAGGYAGTLLGTTSGAALDGTFSVSLLTDAHVLRQGTFSLKR